MLVFIDESGDPGFKLARVSTEVFVAVLVAFQNSDDCNAAVQAIERLASRLCISDEFKFNKSRHEVGTLFFWAVAKCVFRIRAIVVKKALIYSPHLRSDKEAFYLFLRDRC